MVARIKEDPLQTKLLVIGENELKWYQDHGIQVSFDLPNIIRLTPEGEIIEQEGNGHTEVSSGGYPSPKSATDNDSYTAPPPDYQSSVTEV